MPLQLRYSALTLAAVLCAACANDTPVVDMKGQCADANGGEVCTYARVQADHVMEAGAMVPLAAIENAKAGVESMDWPPKSVMTSTLPEVASKQSGLTEMTMYWESTGHPPTPYMVPHFDFHFYIVPPADIAAIDCKDESKPTALPQGYSLPDQDLPPEMQKMMGVEKLVGICVPGMGMHSLPTTELQSTRPFNGTMVIGYYHAKPIFIEPMISKSMLLLKQSFTLPIPEIPGLTTVHPTAFHADFDAATQSYHFRFTDFKGA